MTDDIWKKDGGIYFGFGVEPTIASEEISILDERWKVAPELRNFYPGRFGSGDRHLVTVGPNGSGKTRRLLIPNLFRLKSWSSVVIDIKGELAAYTAAYRANAGQKVVIIDPFGVMEATYPRLVAKYPFLKSNGYNPVASLNPENDDFPDDATRLAEAIIRVEGQEPHWSQSAQDLVAALAMYVRLDKSGGSLADVRRLLGLAATEFRETVGKMIDAGIDHKCEELAVKAGRFAELTGDNKELNSIISTALTQTRWLDSRPIKKDMAQGAFDFSTLKQTPTTIYLIIPPRYLSTHGTWLRVMLTSILLPLLRSVDDAKVPVLFMLDEFAQLGRMQVIEDNLALLRGYGVKLWPVFQDFAQAQSLYKDRWESFVGNAGVLHSFAPQDVTTRKYLSDLSGQRLYWLKVSGTSSSQNMGGQSGLSAGASESIQNMPGPIFWPQGLGTMDLGQGVLFSRGRAVRAYFPDPEDRDDLLQLRDVMESVKRDIVG